LATQFARISGGLEGKSRSLPRGFQVNAAEHRGEFEGGPLDVIRSKRGPVEAASLKPFHPDGVAIAIPIQYLDAIVFSGGEHEEMTREWILSNDVASQSRQPIVPLAEIGRWHGDEDPSVSQEA
jgi:hypothetical protein